MAKPSTLKSDLHLDASKFDPKNIASATHDSNEGLIKIQQGIPKWWEVGAPEFRKMRWEGKTPLPKPVVLESGKNITIPSREPNRKIPCRVFQPQNGKPKGLFYHIHGGGWVLQSEHYQDTMLSYLAEHCDLVVLSVGYRLAPEHPYPAGNEDCFDVADWLVDHAEGEYGAPMKFMGGDSAGAHLSVVTCFHLLESRPAFSFHGLVLNFGAYDLTSFLPQVHNFTQPLVLEKSIMEKYISAYLPTHPTAESRRDKYISPLYADFNEELRGKLPSALFTCGTLDCLLDDSVFMSVKWMMSGAEGILKIYPGAPHGFVFFPPGETSPETQKALDDITTFMNERV